jgi:hypothetical protein
MITVGPSTEYKRWARNAAAKLDEQWRCVFNEPLPSEVEREGRNVPVLINAAIVSYLPTRRLTDADNLYAGPLDVLQAHNHWCEGKKCKVHAGVIEDDSLVRTHNGSDRLYDKDQPRVELTLTPYRPGECVPHPPIEEVEF